MTIYADVIFCVNFFMDMFIFYISCIFMRYKVPVKRLLFFSGMCALLCSIVSIIFFKKSSISILLSIFVFIFSIKMIFKPPSIKIFLNNCAVVMFSAFFTAGIFLWVINMSGIMWFIKNDFFVTTGVFVLCFAVSMGVFTIYHKKVRTNVFESSSFVKAVLCYNEKESEIELLVDTGCNIGINTTGSHTAIVELSSVTGLLSKETSANIILGMDTDEIINKSKITECEDVFGKLEFKTASGNGSIPSFKCICRLYFNDGKHVEIENMVIGIYNSVLINDSSCKGIIGSRELKQIWEGIK